ncbi:MULTISPECIES: hypothetical protein [unclassified Bradyrhizobium]
MINAMWIAVVETRGIDRAAAEEHAHEAGGEDRPDVLAKWHAAGADLGERDRREPDGNDAPAEEGEREGRDRARKPARQNLI